MYGNGDNLNHTLELLDKYEKISVQLHNFCLHLSTLVSNLYLQNKIDTTCNDTQSN